MASREEDFDFSEANSGASLTFPVKCSSLKRSGYVMIGKRPGKIVSVKKSEPGKHGHAKVHIVALDIFTGKKMEEVRPGAHVIEVPEVKKINYKVGACMPSTHLAFGYMNEFMINC